MAELEAITDIRPTKVKPDVRPAQYGRRFLLVTNKPVRLGRDKSKMHWAVPEDDQLSRYFADLMWDGSRLTVERRGVVLPDYPEAPVNMIVVRDPDAKDKFIDVVKAVIGPEESFWIGQTQYTVRDEGLFRQSVSSGGDLLAECENIRLRLDANHIMLDHVGPKGLIDAIRDPDSPALAILGRGFHRLVVIDPLSGSAVPPTPTLQAVQFLEVVWKHVGKAFGLEVEKQQVHPEDVFQILKDEPPSLFCFLEFDLAPSTVLPRVRAFTQGVHRVLLLYRGKSSKHTDEQETDNDFSGPSGSVMPAVFEQLTRTQLEKIPFYDPWIVLKAMEQLPEIIKAASNDQGLFQQILKVVMTALGRVYAAGIVRIPPECPVGEQQLTLVESIVRPTMLTGSKGFAPSRRLAYRAILERRRSCLHCWSMDESDIEESEMTLPFTPVNCSIPWAICTPFQDGSKFALYLAGHVPGQWSSLTKAAQDKILADLTDYQQVAESIVGLIETTLRMNRLSRQNNLLRQAWHRELWQFMDDPVRFEAIIQPQEMEITVLFCDLENYSLFPSEHKAELLPAWKSIASALEIMAATITDKGGVVGGFRGDAMLGFWGWPESRDKQVERAGQVAVRIRDRIGGRSMGKQCGLGVTHGKVLVGRLGAHDLAVVDVYGPVVDLAFRLEAMTKAFGVGVIVSEDVASRISETDPDGEKLRTRKLGNVRASGFPEPIPAYELYSIDNPTVSEWQRYEWNALIDEFTEGKWEVVYDAFSAQFPDDSAAQCLMRFMNATDLHPPQGWDGSFVPPGPPEG
jgi:class 3 adenylate cyclase